MTSSWSRLAAPFLAAAFVSVIGAAQPALASDPFECPVKPLEAAQAAKVKALLPTGDAFADVNQLNTAVTTLRSEGVSNVLIIDNLISAFCGVVAPDTLMTGAQKTARVSRFAANITRAVFSIEGADQIIIDVAFPPSILDAINAKAAAAGLSAEAWIQGAVTTALGK